MDQPRVGKIASYGKRLFGCNSFNVVVRNPSDISYWSKEPTVSLSINALSERDVP